jgi:UDP-N-acetylglucosamine diphosphorylase / glucose-1-phosphate thymidylyltransferase / UDP-N-acetylgalactosamine diphosphorylase / glucosamine-1-phosphate N-acetyltransferase / galactosamine-1-phosphate N-acetyltransferase
MIVVMPMAGRGSRFNGSEYDRPKPLIEVNGRPMFVNALESIRNLAFSKLVIITLQEHEEHFGVTKYLKDFVSYETALIQLEAVTEGQLSTVLAAKPYIDTQEDVLIVSSDTIIDSDLHLDILHKPVSSRGLISVANMPGESWSFAKTDKEGRVVQVAEKVKISDHASTGMYYFSHGADLITFGEEIIRNNERTKGEFYVIPVYQKMIDNGMDVGITQAHAMWDMGTPDALNEYLKGRA